MPPKSPFDGHRDGTKWWAVYTKLHIILQNLEDTLGSESVCMHCTFLCTVYYSGGLYTYVHTYVRTNNKQDKPTCRHWAKTVCGNGWRAPIGHSDFNIGVRGLVLKDSWWPCSLEEEDDDKTRYACRYIVYMPAHAHSQIQPSHWFLSRCKLSCRAEGMLWMVQKTIK